MDTEASIVFFVDSNEPIFLRTIIPGRKATNKYVRIER